MPQPTPLWVQEKRCGRTMAINWWGERLFPTSIQDGLRFKAANFRIARHPPTIKVRPPWAQRPLRIYGHMIDGMDDEAVRKWEGYQRRSRLTQPVNTNHQPRRGESAVRAHANAFRA